MIRYGKTTQTAVSAMSLLAEVYDEGMSLSSGQIAKSRGLSQTLVAKLLTTLSQAELVVGSRGPGGGYRLARPPGRISLLDISSVFERREGNVACPFGPNWCSKGDPCPLHKDYLAFSERFNKWQAKTTLKLFSQSTKSKK